MRVLPSVDEIGRFAATIERPECTLGGQLNSYVHSRANVCIRVAARQPGTTAMGAIWSLALVFVAECRQTIDTVEKVGGRFGLR
jgi:hypothetical protein